MRKNWELKAWSRLVADDRGALAVDHVGLEWISFRGRQFSFSLESMSHERNILRNSMTGYVTEWGHILIYAFTAWLACDLATLKVRLDLDASVRRLFFGWVAYNTNFYCLLIVIASKARGKLLDEKAALFLLPSHFSNKSQVKRTVSAYMKKRLSGNLQFSHSI